MGRKLLAVAVAIATATAALTPAAAQAAQPPAIHYGGSVEGDLGTLEIYMTAEAGIASIRARLFSHFTGEEVASTTDFVLHVGTERDGLWRTPQPLQLPEMG